MGRDRILRVLSNSIDRLMDFLRWASCCYRWLLRREFDVLMTRSGVVCSLVTARSLCSKFPWWEPLSTKEKRSTPNGSSFDASEIRQSSQSESCPKRALSTELVFILWFDWWASKIPNCVRKSAVGWDLRDFGSWNNPYDKTNRMQEKDEFVTSEE